MSTNEKKEPKVTNTEKYPIEAYKILVEMVKKDDTLYWQHNSILFAINGGLLTLLGAIQPKDPTLIYPLINVISIFDCCLGALICLIWFLVGNRIMCFYNHWVEHLKYLEEQYLSPIKVFIQADKYFDEKEEISFGEKTFRLGFIARHTKIFKLISSFSIILLLVWLVLAIFFTIRLCNN